ncbi:MAG TPA: membrane protein insertion efficiency factor YidD [Beutenbergiaceae bacterium]|nr:membrane protein insertion efficiency factor YidD [Beutenbergiaceae bacterium]
MTSADSPATGERGVRDSQHHPDEHDGPEPHLSARPRRRGPLSRMLIWLVRGYQMIVSPWFAPRCRYYPSCSQYAIDAVGKHGAIKGTVLAGWRLLRCNPWSLGGVDHVPEHFGARRTLVGSSSASSPRSAPTRSDRDQM